MSRSTVALAISCFALFATGCSMLGSDDTGEGASEQNEQKKSCAAGDSQCATEIAATEQAKAVADTKPADGQKNGVETDVDCGGALETSPRCADGKTCKAATDCASGVCTSGTCVAPSPTDGVKNGDETDVDCGGAKEGTPRCAVGKACKAHSDCESDGCDYKGKCIAERSCAGHFGGDTCGAGEVGDPDAQHESCCAAAPISDAEDATLLDKYVITAGRMRQFIERMKGNLRAFGETLGDNPDWRPEWNESLPADMDETNFLLGPTGHGTQRAGCDLTAAQGRTYWMSDAENDALGDGHHTFSKDVLDQKALNCVEFYMLQAFCIWDGGRLATQQEIQTAWQGGEGRVYPWGGGDPLDESKIVYKSNYQFPEEFDKGNFIYIAAPGRRPEGNGKFGHSDLAGLVFELTSDANGANVTWSGSGSWEGHTVTPSGAAYGTNLDINRAYWALGGRCARPK